MFYLIPPGRIINHKIFLNLLTKLASIQNTALKGINANKLCKLIENLKVNETTSAINDFFDIGNSLK